MFRTISFFSVFVLLAVAVVIGPAGAVLLGTDGENVIHASGTGSIIGTPDRAQVSLSIVTENSDVKIAQQENAGKMQTVIDAMVAAGIPRDALKTTGYNIYPVYEESKSLLDQKVKTYRVTNTVTVTLHDVSRTGEVIDIAVANGINEASSIRFMLSDEQAQVLRTEALKEAVSRARADAGTVAEAFGVALGSVKEATVEAGYSPVIFENYTLGADLKSASARTPVEAGDVTVTATVSVTYTIR